MISQNIAIILFQTKVNIKQVQSQENLVQITKHN